jgi:uncharacterized caspase-like protein
MRKAGRVLAAVTMAVLLSTAVGHAKRVEWLHRRHAVVQNAAPVIASDKAALVIANSRYPDADTPLAQVAGDANALAGALRDRGYQVELVANATGIEALRAAERLKARVRRGGSVVLYLGGFGVQSRGQNYLIPVDAAIWQERDVRAQGLNISSLLGALKSTGAKTGLAYVDASLRNPFERRFRTYSHGLAPITSDAITPVVTAAAPGQVLENPDQPRSAVMTKLVDRLRSPQPIDRVFKDVQADVRDAMD